MSSLFFWLIALLCRFIKYDLKFCFFDVDDGDMIFGISDDMGMDSDGNMMMRVGDNMAMDMDSGELHFVSGWDDDDDDW